MKPFIHAEETSNGITMRFEDGGCTTISGLNMKLINFTANTVTVKDGSGTTKLYTYNENGIFKSVRTL